MTKRVDEVLSTFAAWCMLSTFTQGMPGMNYTLSVEHKDNTIDFTEELRITIYEIDSSRNGLSYNRGDDIHGALGPPRQIRSESLNCDISQDESAALFDTLEKLKLGDLPQDEKGSDSPCVFGWLTWKGDTKFLRTIPTSARRRTLEKVLLNFVDAQRKKHSKEFVVRKCMIIGDDTRPIEVSLKELLHNPKEYDGKRVRVSGYRHSEFEESSLSVSKHAFEKRDYSQAVWLTGASSFAKDKDHHDQNNAYLTVEGVFGGHPGGNGLWPGEIKRITKIIPK